MPADLDEPIFDDYDERDLPAGVRAELKGVSPAAAYVIGGHLLAAGALLDDDPAAALAHTQAAKKRGGRLQVVREALAEAAYAAEDYKVAAAEYQALRRMTNNDDYVPVLADCQRALGKPAAALELLGAVDPARLSADQRIEAVLVAAGARQDLGQSEEAQRLLRSAIASRRGGRSGQARLRYAYAAALTAAGAVADAASWFESAAEFDPSGRSTGEDPGEAGDEFVVDEEVGADWDAMNEPMVDGESQTATEQAAPEGAEPDAEDAEDAPDPEDAGDAHD